MKPGLGATYRLQLGPGLGFAEAAGRLDRLSALGIETLYCSPVAEAVPGSTHGYDGTDPGRVRGELGGPAGLAGLSAACEARGLGLCIDLVPNHLSTWTGGPWWRQLLAEGPAGEMAEVFDVAWGRPGEPGAGKVTLPLLDRPAPEAVAAGLVRLGERDGQPVVLVGEADLPIAGGRARPGDDLAEVLAAQHYRLVDWHDRADRNYRRFFDIDGLVGVRVEREAVFARTHRLVSELAATGQISAVRVDHVDGLREPAAYLRRLQSATGLPIVVEKILTGDERLRRIWPVRGTTGYEVIDDVGGALVDPDGYARLVSAGRVDGDPAVAEATDAGRRLVVGEHFPGELDRLARALDVDPDGLGALLAHLPVYRTYLAMPARVGSAPAVAPEDLEVLGAAGAAAQAEQVVGALLDPGRLTATLALQQLMGAVMAKGVEDTAWYRLAGPLAFCEVGGDPARDRRDGVARLHLRAAERAADGRAGLVPSSTHDTKRSGDVRARLYALTERVDAFEEGLGAFRRHLAHAVPPGDGSVPDPAGEATLTRTLAQLCLGVLPAAGQDGGGGAGRGDLGERVGEALVKSAREGKQRSSWTAPDEAYEDGLRRLAAAALAEDGRLVRAAFGSLVDEVARLGAVASLAGVVLRATLPGTPDCYEGDEAWQLSLVDPDNRRPVDEAHLTALAARVAALDPPLPGAVAGLRRSWRDGAIKLLVTSRSLSARRIAPDALAPDAGYHAVAAEGPQAGSAVAFLRVGRAGGVVLAVTTRLAGRLEADPGDLPSGASFSHTALELPAGAPGRWREVLSGREVSCHGRRLAVAEALGELPVGVLVGSRVAERR